MNSNGNSPDFKIIPDKKNAGSLRVGIIELIVGNVPSRNWVTRAYDSYFSKQYASITPQAVSVWCRELGHHVFYSTYYGQSDPKSLLPNHLDVVFIGASTRGSALAYALAKLYRMENTLTVIGGPHAMAFPSDCLRFFDLVVGACDKSLIDDILRGHFDPPAVITSGLPLTDIPSVEERMPEIRASAFSNGKPALTSLVPMLASVGCPYTCDFCVDWNNRYIPIGNDRLEADLQYLSKNMPGIIIAYADPNFGVKFDQTMDVIEKIPAERRNPYVMESSLSILKESRLGRLRDTNCIYVAPGVESWGNYSNKAGSGTKTGREKMEQVIGHFGMLRRYVSGLQANFVFGTDVDLGEEPVELTKEFVRALPFVWPTLNIPTPVGGTPLYDKFITEGRILKSMPFAFYFSQINLVSILKNYHPVEYYDHLIDISLSIASGKMFARRMLSKEPLSIRFLHNLRAMAVRQDIARFRQIRGMLKDDAGFRAFHEGRSKTLPEYYHHQFEKKLGPYADLISREERTPRLEEVSLKVVDGAGRKKEGVLLAQ
jgi:radical SAM superfamily enzyme YgiQ (UPF0313 family)